MEAIGNDVVHGAFDYEELEQLGMRPDTIVDFSVNSNPYGPSPLVRQALAQVPIERYPDRMSLELRRAILARDLRSTQFSLDSIICGNGTAELINVIARVLVRSGAKVALLEPTFGEYRAASQLAGATVVAYRASAEEQFALDIAVVCAWLEHERPTLFWLCNPNNPTGQWLDRQALLSLYAVCRRSGTALVIDEAYWHFLLPQESFSAIELVGAMEGPPVIVLRSLTKDYALAGLRLGYAVATPEIIARIRTFLPAWNVSAFAQAAGVAALSDHLYLNVTLSNLALERQAFFQALVARGLRCIPSRTHFCLIAVDDATRVRWALLQKHFLVRDCTSFGLPHYIRVSTQLRDRWEPFVEALREIVA